MTKAKTPKPKPSPSCKDCGSPIKNKDGTGQGRVRKPGPRCATCWEIEDKRRKAVEHERSMAARFGLEPGDYDRLFEAQGGKCYLCGRSSRRRLNVDHDHRLECAGRDHPPERGCRLCVRGLVDDPCNEYIGRVAHDRPEVFARGFWYLTDPPARKILNPPHIGIVSFEELAGVSS